MNGRLGIWPSLDLKGGRIVRLLRGEGKKETVYAGDLVEVARRFETEGADGLHVVDLDAAFGRGENREAIKKILQAVKAMPVQVGGGLRTRDAVGFFLEGGAARAVVGSLPFVDEALFCSLLEENPGRLLVALDCKSGRPTIHGWTEDAGAGTAEEVARRLAGIGVEALLVTDVARDGALEGPNTDLLARVRAAFLGEILASGGMRGEDDLVAVDMALAGGPRGVIFGRALHEGLTTVSRLSRARDALREKVNR